MSASNVSYITGRRITLAGKEYAPREDVPAEVVKGLPVRNFNALVQTHALVPTERSSPHQVDAKVVTPKSQIKRRSVQDNPLPPAA